MHNRGSVLESETYSFLGLGDIKMNNPDLVLINKKKRICHLLYFPIPADESENECKLKQVISTWRIEG